MRSIMIMNQGAALATRFGGTEDSLPGSLLRKEGRHGQEV